MGCTHLERRCNQNTHTINYPMIDINQDSQISKDEFFEYMKHFFGALDKDSSNTLTSNEIDPPSRCSK